MGISPRHDFAFASTDSILVRFQLEGIPYEFRFQTEIRRFLFGSFSTWVEMWCCEVGGIKKTIIISVMTFKKAIVPLSKNDYKRIYPWANNGNNNSDNINSNQTHNDITNKFIPAIPLRLKSRDDPQHSERQAAVLPDPRHWVKKRHMCYHWQSVRNSSSTYHGMCAPDYLCTQLSSDTHRRACGHAFTCWFHVHVWR